ncbi:MAG: orotate phosphoribosyltransferase [Dehalococcoidia bacterium]
MTDQQELLDLAIEINSLLFGNFQLSSGGSSSYYFDGRILTLNPKGSYLTAKCFLPLILESGASFIAGPTLGADPIVASVATFSYLQNSPVNALIVRKEQKEHGGEKIIEGSFAPGSKIAVVDDTCTSGSSLFHAIKAIENEGGEVTKVLSILDRNSGGSKKILDDGYDFFSLFVANDKGQISCNL